MDEDRERLLQIDGAMPRLNAIPAGCAFNPRCPRAFDRCRVERPDLLDAGATRAACWLHAAPREARRMSASADAAPGTPATAARRWSRSHDLAKTFDVSAPWLNRVLERKPRQFAARGRRRQLRHRARPDAGAGRRIGLRQEHGRAPARRPVRADARPRPLRRQDAHAALRDAGGRALRRRMQMIFQDPYASLNPRWKVRRHRRRAAARARRCVDATRSAPIARARRRAAAVGRPGGRRLREVPAPVLRRPAPAHLDRARARDAARVPGLRRADLGARRARCRRRSSTS